MLAAILFEGLVMEELYAEYGDGKCSAIQEVLLYWRSNFDNKQLVSVF